MTFSHRPPALLSAISLMAVVLSTSAPAEAQDDALTGTARDLFVKAARAAEQGKWDQCRAGMLAAYLLKKHPQVAGNLGGCEMQLGLYRDAAEHISFFLRESPPSLPASARSIAEARLEEARRKIGTLKVKVDRAGAEVAVDGRVIGRSPIVEAIFVEPGAHVLEARADGVLPAKSTISVAAGAEREVTLSIAEAQPRRDSAPAAAPQAKRPLWPALAAGGVSAGLLLTGIGLTAAANGKSSTAAGLRAGLGTSGCHDATSAACKTLDDTASSVGHLSNAAVGTFVSAGVFGAAAAALGVWATRSAPASKEASMRVSPVVGPGLGGFGFAGTF